MKGAVLLVSGTDTGVGKTYVSSLLLAALREQGLRVGALKPVETGVTDPAATDAEVLRQAAGGWQELSEVLLYRFPEPLSPHLAAERRGVEISRKHIVQSIYQTASQVDLLLVEGAGGLCVPFSRDWRFIDLIQELDAPLLLVVGSRLGAINHASLSFEALTSRSIKCLGYALSEPPLESPELALAHQAARETNREAIAEQADRYQFFELAYFPLQPQSSLPTQSEPCAQLQHKDVAMQCARKILTSCGFLQ